MSDDTPEHKRLADRDLANAQWGKPPTDQGLQISALERYKPRTPEDIAKGLRNWGANEEIIGRYIRSSEMANMVDDMVGALEVSQQKGASEKYMSREQADNIYKFFGWGDLNIMIPEELRRGKQEVEELHNNFMNKSDVRTTNTTQTVDEVEGTI
ncbi:MAG: hypothetical protein AAB546_00300 [Patescibacteria group bacterium]|mgnify:FL=1